MGNLCNGNDAIRVFNISKRLIQRLRGSHSGPYLLECRTYRWKGHVGPDCDFEKGCRPQRELDFWINKCPIKRLQDHLLKEGLLTKGKIEKILQQIKEEIKKAELFAKTSHVPAARELYKDVYWKE